MGYNFVTGRLAQGSVPHEGAQLASEFDVVVLCAQEFQNVYLPGVEVLKCPLDDDERAHRYGMTAREVTDAWNTAKRVARRLRAGKRVLVTCAKGYNRSGLITGLVLRIYGYTAREAVMRIRHVRGLRALGNEHFVKLLSQVTPVDENVRVRLSP